MTVTFKTPLWRVARAGIGPKKRATPGRPLFIAMGRDEKFKLA
jgi:hypothetical protein